MTVVLDWIGDRAEYEALFDAAPHSTLLQSWGWGEAKAEAEGWRPRRALLSAGGRPVAVAQVLERRLGPLRIARLNRGPVAVRPDADGAACLAALRRHWRWWTGAALMAAPEWPAGDEARLRALGFRGRRAPVWRSAWLELESGPAALRKGLNGKWRNMLVNAEKAGMTVTAMAGAEGVDWLMPRYEAMMADKGFSATSPALLRALARHVRPDDLLCLAAHAEGMAAAAVLVVRHGAAATYLIGWNSDVGRRLRGNHLLLWQAVLACGERGCRAFDLGGIDDVLTPGVASFKRGLNGAEYALAGEWLSF